ncbi:hypothetical protein [Bacteriovorax sp. DB6_IX]|uniref:hypothetical protein n=1 Tax=Bacteriovorax sp. DB6_IX TaxID=1353530 RepID=UPI000389E8CA|nr:hypothetical protein [Bacteriovorax sp. DB6_IX]EQC51387.1 hypothetical protein M901_2443 [Bacteriovorax sp. DB6_IX]
MSDTKKETNETKVKKEYLRPEIKTEDLKVASAGGGGGGGGGGKVCNGGFNGGRKDTLGNGCSTLLT